MSAPVLLVKEDGAGLSHGMWASRDAQGTYVRRGWRVCTDVERERHAASPYGRWDARKACAGGCGKRLHPLAGERCQVCARRATVAPKPRPRTDAERRRRKLERAHELQREQAAAEAERRSKAKRGAAKAAGTTGS